MEQAPNPRYTKKDSGTYEVEEVEVGSSFTLTKLDETPGPKITTKRQNPNESEIPLINLSVKQTEKARKHGDHTPESSQLSMDTDKED